MSFHVPDPSVAEAQRRINAILADLEKITGAVVKDLSIGRIDTTNIESKTPEFLTTCIIELERIPSQNWSV